MLTFDLQSSEQAFSQLFHSIPNMMVLTEPTQGEIIDCTSSLAIFLGYKREEIIGRTTLDFGIWEKPEDRKKMLDELHTGKRIQYLPLKLRNRTGGSSKVLFRIEKITLGEKPYFLCVLSDMEERERAEALRVSEEKYRALVENTLLGLAILRDDSIVFCNQAFAGISGYSMDELLQLGFAAVIYPEDQKHLQAFNPARQDAIPQDLKIAIRMIRKDGSLRWVEACASVIRYDGRPAVQVACMDITELKESQDYLNRVINSMSDAVMVKDRRHRYLIANDSFCRQAGRPREEFIGKEVRDIVRGELGEQLWRLDEQVMSTKKELLEEQEVSDPAGNKRTLLTKRSVLLDKNGDIQLISSMRDITEHRHLQEQFQQSQKMEAIGVLAGGIAHDFNNLLNVINGYTELILEDLEQDSPIREELAQIRDSGLRAASLTAQLLAFSRKQLIQPEYLNLTEIINEMTKMLTRVMGEDIRVSAAGTPDLWHIYADPGQMHQVVMNLAVNARDAMPKGGRFTVETANIRIEEDYVLSHPVTKPGDYVLLTVSDNGTGMDAATQDRLFEPFFTTKEKGKGTGLGLSTVYGIVKQNKGYIWVYSEPGKGTAFKLYFPRAEGETKALDPVQTPNTFKGTGTILVVEDETSLRNLAGRILRDRGYTVIEASDGLEALRLSAKTKDSIDLVLTDAVMPQMGGKELVEHLKSSRPGIKALYMSGYTDKSIVENGILNADIEFLQKPFKVETLARKVWEILSSGTIG